LPTIFTDLTSQVIDSTPIEAYGWRGQLPTVNA